MKFIRRPNIINAVQIRGHKFDPNDTWPDWLIHAWDLGPGVGGFWESTDGRLYIGKEQGVEVVDPQDWVIKDENDELYTVSADLFDAEYEQVDDDRIL